MNGWLFSGRSMKRKALVVLAVSGVVSMFIVAVVVAAMLSIPDWWEHAAPPLKDAEIQAEFFENETMRKASLVRAAGSQRPPQGMSYQSDEWLYEITQDHANAWIANRLPKWLSNQNRSNETIERLASIRVSFDRSGAHVGLPLQIADVRMIAWTIINPIADMERGPVIGPFQVHLGRIAVSSSLLSNVVDDDIDQVLKRIQSGEPIAAPLVLNLEDGRRIRVRRLEFGDGVVRAYCRTEK